MAQAKQPALTSQTQHATPPSPSTSPTPPPLLRHSSSMSTVSSRASTPPGAANAPPTGAVTSSSPSAAPNSSQATGQRPSIAGHRHTSEKAHQFLSHTFSPSTHDPVDLPGISTPATVRKYSRRTQRWRLWKLVWFEWVITVVLCVALWGLLYGYAKGSVSVPTKQKHIFNALATGISIALGLNLAGSLRSYVKILRWRLLGARYRPLSEFELLLQSERLSSIFLLLWRARSRRHRYLPSEVQLLCILWIFINIAAAVLVAMLGLTYNLTQSPIYLTTVNGPVSVIDFNSLLQYGYLTGLSTAQQFGLDGSNFLVVTGTLDQANQTLSAYENVGGTSRYWFTDYNPLDITIDLATYRYVDSVVNCDEFPVTAGIYGNQSSVTYTVNGRDVVQHLSDTGQPGSGGMTIMSDTAETCGSRCTTTMVFQAASDPANYSDGSDVYKSKFFICNNTMSQVANIPSESYNDYLLPDEIARMLAGAMGWTGVVVPGTTQQFEVYPSSSTFTWGITANASDISSELSGFSIAAVASMDDPGNAFAPRQTIQGAEPFHADYLQVTWWHAGPLLIGIPCLQLATLMAVIAVGNRAIIKDDSFLSVAKLYKSTIDRMGDHGCMLRGHEIIDQLRDPDDHTEPEVIYAWKEVGRDDFGMIGHVDVFDVRSNIDCKPAFDEGRFDGGAVTAAPRRKKLKTD